MLTENDFLNEQECAAYTKDMAAITAALIQKMAAVADKYNVDIEGVIQHFVIIFFKNGFSRLIKYL